MPLLESSPSTVQDIASGVSSDGPTGVAAGADIGTSAQVVELMDMAFGAVASAARSGALEAGAEAQAVSRILMHDTSILLVAKHFASSNRFAQYLRAALQTPATPLAMLGASAVGKGRASTRGVQASMAVGLPDALVVGTGVAGLTAALRLLDAGANVVLMDKERRTGGNSAKASSGINACCPQHSRTDANAADSIEAFANDTARSAKREPDGLIGLLASSSADAIKWLQERTGIDLSRLAQLGGHSFARTHRPANGMVGSELTVALSRAVKKFEATGQLRLMLGCRVTKLEVDDDGRVTGVSYVDQASGQSGIIKAHDTVLATGGFANDRSNTSLLAKHRPDLVHFPTTNGPWATGDGMKMAMAIGAGSIDMDKVQIHPTGFLDPRELSAPAKTLCGEMMRGVGGVLLTPDGRRFVNELLPRDQVVAAELESGASEFVLLLNDDMAKEAGKHTDHYVHKGLLVKLEGASDLAKWMLANTDGTDGQAPDQVAERAAGVDARGAALLLSTIEATLAEYNAAAERGVDGFGKTTFRHAPILPAGGPLYAGRIVPVLHYTMGGIRMGADGSVLRDDGSVIPGLHAAGEVTGGVHGNNRLGGNSLLDCTVFGSIVGNKLAAKLPQRRAAAAAAALPAHGLPHQLEASANNGRVVEASDGIDSSMRIVSRSELAAHAGDPWVALYGRVYDFTQFIADDEHNPGPKPIYDVGGVDGTAAFKVVHNEGMLDDIPVIGVLED